MFEGNEHLEDPGVDARVILKCILKKWGGRVSDELNWLRIENSGLFV
jgi:hypothetical protein